MFGIVTKTQLDRKVEELRAEFQAAVRFEEDIKYEWAEWYNKFRLLHARLMKRDLPKDPKDELAAGDSNGKNPPADSEVPVARSFPNSRRGF